MSDAESISGEVPASRLVDSLKVDKTTLHKWIDRGKIGPDYYCYREGPGHGGRTLCIDPRGLPKEYLETWVNARIESGDLPTPSEEETRSHEWKTAAGWRKEEARKRCRFLKAVPAELTTEQKKEAVATYNEETPNEEQPGGVSMASWYRYKNAYDAGGLAGLMPNPRPSRGTKISETDYNRFKDLYLTRDRRSARECWRRVYGAAQEEGRDVEDFPVAQTFVNAVKRTEGEDLVTYMRKGPDAFYQKGSPHTHRDWSQVAAGDVWFSDHRLFDVFVLDTSTGEVGRPWFTPWMDARSTKFLSWDVYMEHPNSGRIHVSFKRAVEEYGIPKAAYIDNGKDYRALDFAGGRNKKKVAPEVDEERSRNVLDLMGVEPVFAKPYNARAKTVERKFQFFIENLEKFSRGYAGQDAKRRPEITERRRKASGRHPDAAEEMDFLCTLEEFRERVDEWAQRINRIPSDGRILGGHSPKEIFYAKRGEVRHIEPKHLGILCLRTSGERQIRRCEWHDRELDIYYHAEWMYESRVQGTTAFARRDPQDPEQAWIFNAEDGSLMGVAERKEEVHPMAATLGDEEDQEELEEQLRLQREYINGLEEKRKEIEESQPSEETLDRWYDAYLDAKEEERRDEGDYLEGEGPEEIEHKPHETAQEWLDQAEAQEQAGRDDLPYDPDKAASEEAGTEDDTDDSLDADDLKIWPDE